MSPPYSVTAVQAALTPLDLSVSDYPPPVRAYFHYYGLDCFAAHHAFGSLTTTAATLAVHVFRPPASRGTVLLVHGYYDHSGIWRSVIAALLAAGYNVITYDQPGHGLSSGARASIGDFAEYRNALTAVLHHFSALCTTPALVAHSLGAAVVVDYLLHPPYPPPTHVVLLAPLVRSALWHLSCFSQRLLGNWLTAPPRVWRKNSADPNFVAFIRRDPLQPRYAPLPWFQALRRWNNELVTWTPCPQPLTILQGNADTVVDWRYNLALLQQRFPTHITLVQGARHQLHNETLPLRTYVLQTLLDSLNRN